MRELGDTVAWVFGVLLSCVVFPLLTLWSCIQVGYCVVP